MVDKLNVTPEQKVKLDPILDADAKQVRALRTDTALSSVCRPAREDASFAALPASWW